jgi:hypothetical protein
MKKSLTTAEEIAHYDFVNDEVLKAEEEIMRRKDNLYMALILGRNYNKMVWLKARTVTGTQTIEGIMHALTEEFIILKNGTKIPVCCIEESKIY